MNEPGRPGVIGRLWRGLFSPSARWSVFTLVLAGVVVGFVGVVGTQVAVHLTGTDEFCGTACHSHASFVFPEHQQSVHYTNRTGVRPACVDCHLPHTYPAKLIAKAKAGVVDMLGEMRGSIATKEKFEAERWRLANIVWDEMKANNSENCRSCHNPEAWDPQKQSEDAQKSHRKFKAGKATCIECHTGVAHKEPEEPPAPARAASAAG